MMALAWLGKALATPLTETILALLREARERHMGEQALRMELERAIAENVARVAAEELRTRRDVLRAEMAGESALQRLWRPVVALTAFFSYWYVIVAVPHLVAWGVMAPPRFGEKGLDNLFWLAAISVGGYIGARTAEKLARLRRPAP